MAFARGDVVQCVSPDAYDRVQSTLICADGSSFRLRADDLGPNKHRRPFIVVGTVEKSANPKHPKLVMLISISSGLPKVGGQTSFPMVVNYLCCSPESIPYKTGSYIVYGLGAVAREEDLEPVWSRPAPNGEIQKVSLSHLPAHDRKIHEAAMTKAWSGKERLLITQWKPALKAEETKAQATGGKSPSQPDLTPVK